MSIDTSPLFSASNPLIRNQFPSLDCPVIFFDNPGGTQIARQSAERIQRTLLECNADHEGAFATSQQCDAILDEGHAARPPGGNHQKFPSMDRSGSTASTI